LLSNNTLTALLPHDPGVVEAPMTATVTGLNSFCQLSADTLGEFVTINYLWSILPFKGNNQDTRYKSQIITNYQISISKRLNNVICYFSGYCILVIGTFI
jgi:hypothetical protein